MTAATYPGRCRKRPPNDSPTAAFPECCGLPPHHAGDCEDEITGRRWDRDEARLPLDEETR